MMIWIIWIGPTNIIKIKKIKRGKPRERLKRENAINIGWRSLRSC
jgi:hypothetical protein